MRRRAPFLLACVAAVAAGCSAGMPPTVTVVATPDAGAGNVPPRADAGGGDGVDSGWLPPVEPGGEMCNGRDDDGDGSVDEVDLTVQTLLVTFDERTLLEPGHALVHIHNGDGSEIEESPFSGAELAGRTVRARGSRVRIRFVTDAQAVPLFGYKVVRIADDIGREARGALPESPYEDPETHAYAPGIEEEAGFEMPDSLGTGLTCGTDVGSCSQGETACVGGMVLCTGDLRPIEERCNGADDDCDGEVDEDTAPDGWSCLAPGSFRMGSPDSELGRSDGERDHEVRLTRPLLVATTEVTREDWAAHLEQDPSPVRCEGCPAQGMTWHEALAYCNALSVAAGLEPCYRDQERGYVYNASDASDAKEPEWANGLDCEGFRLPTEAEWEYLARAGTGTPYSSGNNRVTSCDEDEDLLPVAWYCANSGDAPKVVGEKEPNAWGLHDVHGNLWEWTWDSWRDHLPSDSRTDPVFHNDEDDRHVIRGGAFDAAAAACRSAARGAANREERRAHVGLRPVRTVRPPE